MPKKARRTRIKLVDEHIASRKDWGAYLDLSTMLHRSTASRAEEFLADMRKRLARRGR